MFSKNIKCIKLSDNEELYRDKVNLVISECIENEYEGVILLQSEKELEEVELEYKKFEDLIKSILKIENIPISESKIDILDENGYTNIIIVSIILITIFIGVLMVLVKLKG